MTGASFGPVAGAPAGIGTSMRGGSSRTLTLAARRRSFSKTARRSATARWVRISRIRAIASFLGALPKRGLFCS